MSSGTIVLVHGAFADGSSWSKVIAPLLKLGYAVASVQNPTSSLSDDVNAVRRVVAMQPGPVLLVGHSWGGVVITEAGNLPAVKGLVYVAAGAPDTNQSFAEWFADYPPPSGAAEIKPYGEGYLALTREGVRHHFAQDLDEAEADLVHAVQLPFAARCFDDKVSAASWRDKPCWYVVAADDRTLPTAAEQDSARRMGADTTVLNSSHVPMLSQPEQMVGVIVRAAKSVFE